MATTKGNPPSIDARDDVVTEVMLHAGKTRAYLRRLKKTRPNDWKRVYGNVFRAMVELDEEFIDRVK